MSATPSTDWAVPPITAELPGIGGTLRVSPEDFTVEELPAYTPSGVGEHLFLWVEKRGRNTRDVARALARALALPESGIGVAGQKDRHALTRQYFSAPRGARTPEEIRGLEGDGWRVLDATFHGNKLKLGHLRGNRFTITIRDVVPDALTRAEAIAAALSSRGLPNAFGPQRFGRDGLNTLMGQALISEARRGSASDANPVPASTPSLPPGLASELARFRRDRFLRRMALSALQSALFNRALVERMRLGLFDRAVAGDLMKKRETGGLFHCESTEADTPRVQSFEIAPTGPIAGHRMMRPRAEALALEDALWAKVGLSPEDFAPFKADGEGSRRPYRLLVELTVEALPEERALRARFALPKGSFATTVLAELMKTGATIGAADAVDLD